ncbi:MAG: hypothetical protein ACKVW3_15105 [Phycisphaerales bacterium]
MQLARLAASISLSFAAALFAIVSPAAAQPPATTASAPAKADTPPVEPETVLTLKDGQRFTGFLVERTPERLILRIAGIPTTIRADLVDRVNVLPPVVDRYRAMRVAIDDNDTERLVLLAEWLRARAQWTLALTELDHVLALQPENPEAIRLRVLVLSQQRLAERTGDAPTTPTAPRPAAPVPPAPADDFPVLNAEQINLLRVYEVNLSDPPRISIDRETIASLIEAHAGDPLIPDDPEGRDALYRASASRILDLMFRLKARDLYPRVHVSDHPKSIRLFRENVQRAWLANSCATTSCHGGAQSGRLRLIASRPVSDPTVYTNLLILDRHRLADGKPIIDYDDPASSPLLQAALPHERSRFKHPRVPGPDGRGDLWKPAFQTTQDRRFLQAVEWIRTMYRPRPNYPIVYEPPASVPPAPPQPVER